MRIGVIADFNTENLARMLEKHCGDLDATVSRAPFGQVMQTLLEPSADFWHRPYDLIVLWTMPQSVVTTFNDIVDFREWDANGLEREVEAFVEAVRGMTARVGNVFLPSWVLAPTKEQRPSIEMNSRVGATAALLRMNLRLVEGFDKTSGVVLFNTERWLRKGGSDLTGDKLWYLSKTPFSKNVFDEAARDMVATFRGIKGQRRKVIVLDLDNTIWGGTVGDVGWEAIQIGGHDAIGEAYLQFQRELKRLSREGVALAIVSKNDEAIAFEAIDKNTEMELRSGDFAAWRINWNDKAENIVAVMNELSLGLESAVFLDDSPHERARIRQALPEVLVPDWPSDPMDYGRALRDLRCFELSSLSKEDRTRTQMYVADRERKQLRLEHSVDTWLQMLDIEVSVAPLTAATTERASQLLNKTNQMNLATRRLSTQEFAAWASLGNHQVWTFSVKDRIGDYGLCGVASVAFLPSGPHLVDFVVSCRAMGRGVEETIISTVAAKVREAGFESFSATYLATKKNAPCLRWIQGQTWFSVKGGDTFLIDATGDLPPPKHIRISFQPDAIRKGA